MLKDNIDTTLSPRLRLKSAALMHRTTHLQYARTAVSPTHTHTHKHKTNIEAIRVCLHVCVCVRVCVCVKESDRWREEGVEDDRLHADASVCVLSLPLLSP